MCARAYAHVKWHVGLGQKTGCGSQFSPSIRWAPQTELRSSVLWQASLPTEASHRAHELFIHLLILKIANNKNPWKRSATLHL